MFDNIKNLVKCSPLLHVCCAPCCGPVVEKLIGDGLLPTIFFYNPNIYPAQEYEYRKASVMQFINKLGLAYVDCDYDTSSWFKLVKGMEDCPERGIRCSICFDLRMQKTASYAYEHGFKYFATTNGISARKNIGQVNQSGLAAAARYPSLTFIALNWRLVGNIGNISTIAKREKFYKQEYCGCKYSLEERNRNRAARGFAAVEHGKSYY